MWHVFRAELRSAPSCSHACLWKADAASERKALPELCSAALTQRLPNAQERCAARRQLFNLLVLSGFPWLPLASLGFPLLQSIETDSASDTQAFPELRSGAPEEKLAKRMATLRSTRSTAAGCPIYSCRLASLGFTRLTLKHAQTDSASGRQALLELRSGAF